MKRSRGFTVIELVAVVSILGVLSGIALPRVNEYMARSRTSRAAADMRILQTAVDIYAARYGGFPAQVTDDRRGGGTVMWGLLMDNGYIGGIPVAVTGDYFKASDGSYVTVADGFYGFDKDEQLVTFG